MCVCVIVCVRWCVSCVCVFVEYNLPKIGSIQRDIGGQEIRDLILGQTNPFDQESWLIYTYIYIYIYIYI